MLPRGSMNHASILFSHHYVNSFYIISYLILYILIFGTYCNFYCLIIIYCTLHTYSIILFIMSYPISYFILLQIV